ncbi:MAG: hypothetical protein EOO02_07880, partial [Chitinophagaceae bacterium]
MKVSVISMPKASFVVAILVLFTVISAFRLQEGSEPNGDVHTKIAGIDSIQSITAFGEVYKVLVSPRCMNCHPAGDVPLQGDDSHLH